MFSSTTPKNAVTIAPVRSVIASVLNQALAFVFGVLVAVFVVVILAATATLFGWNANNILTGSMKPSIMPGDSIVFRPVQDGDLVPGTVLSYRATHIDPHTLEEVSISITHRVLSVNADGSVVMKGDNNDVADSVAVTEADVLGVVVFVIERGERIWMFAALSALALLAFLLRRASTFVESSIARTARRRDAGSHSGSMTSQVTRRCEVVDSLAQA